MQTRARHGKRCRAGTARPGVGKQLRTQRPGKGSLRAEPRAEDRSAGRGAQGRAATGLRWAGLARLASLRGSNTQARAERRRRGDGWRREPRRLGWGRDQGLGIFSGS